MSAHTHAQLGQGVLSFDDLSCVFAFRLIPCPRSDPVGWPWGSQAAAGHQVSEQKKKKENKIGEKRGVGFIWDCIDPQIDRKVDPHSKCIGHRATMYCSWNHCIRLDRPVDQYRQVKQITNLGGTENPPTNHHPLGKSISVQSHWLGVYIYIYIHDVGRALFSMVVDGSLS